jgi:PBSX family phage terminase large subunit
MREIDQTWFKPLPKQAEALAAREREVVYAGGVGAGKTLVGGFKALKVAMTHPGTVGLIARQTAGALAANTQKVILEGDDKPPIIPAEMIAHRSEKYGTTITLHNGSQILFRSFQDWNDKKLLGPNYGFVYIDEATECTEKVWTLFGGRLRHPAGPQQIWGTTNPNGHDWLWRRFHPDSGQAVDGSCFIHAPTEENTHLSPEYVKWLRAQPREWQKRYVDANFDTAAGQIWDEWNWRIHVTPAFPVPYQWKRSRALDHGRRNPTAVLWFAQDEDGFVVVEDGYYEPGLVSQHAPAIKLTDERTGARGPITADPSVFTASFDGQTVAAEYQKHGLSLTPGNNNVDAGLLRVSEWLRRREGLAFPAWHQYAGTLGPDGLGSPLLFVLDTPATQPLRMEIPDYRWRDLSPTQEEKADQPEEPRKKDDHACDSAPLWSARARAAVQGRDARGRTADAAEGADGRARGQEVLSFSPRRAGSSKRSCRRACTRTITFHPRDSIQRTRLRRSLDRLSIHGVAQHVAHAAHLRREAR